MITFVCSVNLVYFRLREMRCMNEELTAVRQTLQQQTNRSNHQRDTEQRLVCVSAGHFEEFVHKVAEASNLCS